MESDEFAQYAATAQQRLYRTAFLLCGDTDAARDLTQETLVRLFRYWPKVRRAESPDAYAKRTLLNIFLDDRRRRRRQHDADRLSSHRDQVDAEPVELRLSVTAALARLPASRRAVLVLRYFEDLSIQETADLLGCSAGNVKSQTSRGLAALQELLGDQRRELSES